MKKLSAKGILAWRAAAFIISTAGILLHLLDYKILNKELLESGFMIRHKLAYFTVQTNIFIAALFGFLLIKTLLACKREKKCRIIVIKPKIQAALSLYITITMLGFWLVLAPMTGLPKDPFLFFSSSLLHAVTPLLALIDFAAFGVHGELKAKDALGWLIYPFAYLIFVMLFSRTIQEPYYSFKIGGELIELMYPYPFLDPKVMGVWGVAAAAAILAVLFYLLGRLFIYLDSRAAKKAERL